MSATDAVNNGACCQEEEALEEGVRHQMEDAGRIRSHTGGHEHVSELRDGRVRENLLDIGLRNANGGGKESGQRSDNRDYRQRGWCPVKDHVRTGDHIDAGRHHGCGVDES